MSRELPAWGKLALFIDYRWNWLWADAPTVTVREKFFGNLMRLDLSNWSDRLNYFLKRWYDLELQLLLADLARPGQTIVDVGAHRGEFALAASKLVGKSGRVLCFEPNPKSIEMLALEAEANAANNIVIHPCGLSDADDTLKLTVDRGIGNFGDVPFDASNEIFSVNVRRGDGLLQGENPSLIKIDIEGFETKAIRGLAQTIKRCLPIVVTEVDRRLLGYAHSSVEELKDCMEGLGYKGFMLTLKKRCRRYDWQLAEFDPAVNSDVVWVSGASPHNELVHMHMDPQLHGP